MPEGDTIHTVARAMAPRLEGQTVDALWLRDVGPVARAEGSVVSRLWARGKHLLIALERPGEGSPPGIVRVHLGMDGSWHRYPRGRRWRLPERLATVRIDAAGQDFVCFQARDHELFAAAALPHHPRLSKLGPDLIADPCDGPAVVARARQRRASRRGTWTLGELLLDQTVACGIGNVFKSETLFMHRLDPWTPVDDVSDETLAALYTTAAEWLQDNVGRVPRVTTRKRADGPVDLAPGEARAWVYGRLQRPCHVCRTPVEVHRQGDQQRVTYWCPRCQGPGPARRGRPSRRRSPDGRR